VKLDEFAPALPGESKDTATVAAASEPTTLCLRIESFLCVNQETRC
jgi:hypothetical protein